MTIDILQFHRELKESLQKSDLLVRLSLSIIVGRLKSAGCYHCDLIALKKELKSFNSKTRKWAE